MEDLDKDRAPVVLIKALAVIAAPFVSSSNEAAGLIPRWIDDVDVYIMRNLASFTILNLQIILLWTTHHHINGNLAKTWMLISLAARLAYCLQINVDTKSGTFSEIECRRRMMWSIVIQDRLLAGTVGEFSLCSRFLDSLTLPCDEHFYVIEMPVDTHNMTQPGGTNPMPYFGGFAALIRLIEIMREIHLYVNACLALPPEDHLVMKVQALLTILHAGS